MPCEELLFGPYRAFFTGILLHTFQQTLLQHTGGKQNDEIKAYNTSFEVFPEKRYFLIKYHVYFQLPLGTKREARCPFNLSGVRLV